jgi:hypothetical protein
MLVDKSSSSRAERACYLLQVQKAESETLRKERLARQRRLEASTAQQLG